MNKLGMKQQFAALAISALGFTLGFSLLLAPSSVTAQAGATSDYKHAVADKIAKANKLRATTVTPR